MKLTIFADLRITRRKLFHVVQDEMTEIVFRSRLIGECIEYCFAEGATEVVLTAVVERADKEPGSYLVVKGPK